jgi:hypothetical protein
MENAINTTEKHISISEKEKPFTELKRDSIKYIPIKVVNDIKN